MNFLENLRKYSFWLQDYLKGGEVAVHLRDLQKVLSTDASDNTVILTARLSKILAHAANTTEFYASYKNKPISEFPVVNKNIIKADFKKFQSFKSTNYRLFPLITSGSTGTPFKIFQDLNKRRRNSADTIYFASQANYELGNKLFYLKIWSDYNKKSAFKRWIQNIVPVDVINLQKNSSSIVEQLNSNHSPICLIGYVSSFEILCNYLTRNAQKITAEINSIITMSESLDENSKKTIESCFDCQVFARYSNIENGIIAQQTKLCPDFYLINSASYLLEIFDMNSDIPLGVGETGRIVITDYFNYATPMIRYDTGDIGRLVEVSIKGSSKLTLDKIEGRKLDQIYKTNGELISSYIVYKNMWKYTDIDQYQLIQKDKNNFLFRISIDKPFEKQNELIGEFKQFLGNDADIEVEYIREIPLLNSGKRKKVVNLMNSVG